MRPSSQSLRDYGQYQRIIMLILFIVSGLYLGIARYMDAPIFTVASHGAFILNYSAELWLAPLFIGTAVHLLAQVVNGDHRLAPWITPFLRMTSAFVVAADLLLYAYGGTFAVNYAPDFMYSAVGGIISLWFTLLGLQDLRRGLFVMREVRHGGARGD